MTAREDVASENIGQQAAPRPWVAPVQALIPAAVTLAVTMYEIGRPSFGNDEGATLADANRTIPQIFALLGHFDAVHGLYYLFIGCVIKVAGTSELAVRFPSAVGMAVAAGAITLLGRRLVSARAGLAAGLLFAALPTVSAYGQLARPYAFVVALATIASYLLVRALEAPEGARRRWLIGYGVILTLAGLDFLFALLLIAAHALTLAVWVRRSRTAGWPLVVGWLAAAAVAVAAASPVAVLGWKQGGAGWIKRPGLQAVLGTTQMIGPGPVFTAVVVVTAAAILVSALRGVRHFRAEWPGRLILLCLPWLVLPPAILLTASQIHPAYTLRYILCSLPAAVLLAGAGLAALGRAAGALALIVIVVSALPAQATIRSLDWHSTDMRAISQYLGDHARPGDALMFGRRRDRKIEAAYPAGFRSLHDISLGETALQAARPYGQNAPRAVVSRRLSAVNRVWLIRFTRSRDWLPLLRHLGFRSESRLGIDGYIIGLYVRRAAPG